MCGYATVFYFSPQYTPRAHFGTQSLYSFCFCSFYGHFLHPSSLVSVDCWFVPEWWGFFRSYFVCILILGAFRVNQVAAVHVILVRHVSCRPEIPRPKMSGFLEFILSTALGGPGILYPFVAFGKLVSWLVIFYKWSLMFGCCIIDIWLMKLWMIPPSELYFSSNKVEAQAR